MNSALKKLTLIVMFLFPATSALALNPVDAMTCKEVKLKEANNRTVLVRRLTGQVLYVKQHDGSWVKATQEQKKKYQPLYNAQAQPEKTYKYQSF